MPSGYEVKKLRVKHREKPARMGGVWAAYGWPSGGEMKKFCVQRRDEAARRGVARIPPPPPNAPHSPPPPSPEGGGKPVFEEGEKVGRAEGGINEECRMQSCGYDPNDSTQTTIVENLGWRGINAECRTQNAE